MSIHCTETIRTNCVYIGIGYDKSGGQQATNVMAYQPQMVKFPENFTLHPPYIYTVYDLIVCPICSLNTKQSLSNIIPLYLLLTLLVSLTQLLLDSSVSALISY